MAQEYWQKIKLLKLLELLRQETDEENPMSTNDICARLNAMGISCDRRTLSRDIGLLNGQGYEVLSMRLGKGNAYYVADRSFSVPELKILIDAVQAASFITEKKTGELVDKIAALGGSYRADILKSNIVCFNTRKHKNESIYYNVDALESALSQMKKAGFRYFDLDMEGRKNYRKDGRHYIVEPVALVFNEDNYYLIAYSEKHGGTANYRLDRMDAVDVVDEDVSDKALLLRNKVSEYTGQAFKMYGGRTTDIVLEFDSKLIGAVHDRFGEGTSMMAAGEGRCVASVTVQLSPTFWGWLFQFAGEMKILSPESAVNEYKKTAARANE